MLSNHDAGDGVDGALAGYKTSGFLPFSYVAPQGADWREGGQRRLGAEV
jgi:hypothetical protein